VQIHSVSYDLATRRWNARFPAGDSPRTLVTVFGAPALGDHPELFVDLARAYPRSLVIGCSSAGEIHGSTVRDGTLAVTVTRFDRTELQLASVDIPSVADSESAGTELGRRLAAMPGLRAVLVLCDGLSVDGGRFAAALSAAAGPSVVVTGGLAADGLDFKQTWLTIGGSIKRGAGAAVGFYGPHFVIGHGVSSDWIAQRAEWVITRSEGNFVYELDYQPALDVYRRALADRGDELPDVAVWFPLHVQAGSEPPVVRTVIGVDEHDGALVLAGAVRNGQIARLLTADLEHLIEGAARATSSATRTGAPVSVDCLALAVSCFARRKILGSWSTEELAALREGLHAQRTTVTGFYAYGQIAPHGGEAAALHNQTLSLTVLSEARPADTAAPRAARATTPPTPSGYAVRTTSFDARAGTWSAPLAALDSPRTLVIAFGSSEQWTDRRGLDAVLREYPTSVILGCSTAGEIHDTTVQDRSLAVSVIRFERTDLELASERIEAARPVREAARRLARRLDARPNLRGVLVFAEGLRVNGSELALGINDVLGGAVPVIGGLAGDGTAFARTWVVAGREVGSDLVAAVGFYGNHVQLGHGVRGGWDRFGLKRTITRSHGNVLHELDGRPALQIYKEYLGERASQLPAAGLSLPLAVRDPQTEAQVVRTLVAIDEAEGSMRFAGDVPAGHVTQFMKADVERLINGATHAALMASENGAPVAADGLVVAISCAGRRHMLGARVEEEVEAVAATLRSDRLRISGLYAYGEISPGPDGQCQLHNQALSLLIITEAKAPLARSDRARPAAPGDVVQARRAFDRAVTVEAEIDASASRRSSPTLAMAVAPAAPPPTPETAAAEAPPAAQPVEAAAPAPEPTVEPRGPIVRVPPPGAAELSIEDTTVQGVRVVTLRGRITEAFKGEVTARLLRDRVILDLGDVSRVTSFGVREWLAMFASVRDLTECYFARCSEAVVMQLSMIRAFDGGARILSFFAPYLCTGCNRPFERLLDCELDAAEIASAAPEPVRCPRCETQGRFDDDPRSYFAFFGSRGGAPPGIRALHAALCAQDQVRPAEDIEKIVEDDVTRVRVTGRLSIHIRWRRVLEHVDTALVIDLSGVTSVEASGVQSLDVHLRTMTSNKPVAIEHAPMMLIERLVSRPAPQLEIRSVMVNAVCPTCRVARNTTIVLDQYLKDSALVTCKRCDARLGLTIEPALEHYLAQRAGRSAPPPLAAAIAAEVPPPPPARTRRRRIATTAAVAIAALSGAGAVVIWRPVDVAPAKPAAKIVELAPASAGVPAPRSDKLPPSWADRPFTLDPTSAYVVGSSDSQAMDAALAEARSAATGHLIEQLYQEIGASPVRAYVAGRVPDARASAAAIARFTAQYGKLASFERIEVASQQTAARTRVFVRFALPIATFQQIVDDYRATTSVRGAVVAQLFPMLADAIPTTGNLIVLDVPESSPIAGKVAAGDVVLRVGAAPVTTVAGLRAAWRSAWVQPDVRARLTLDLETAGAPRSVFIGVSPRRSR